jgi:uncharacterized protein (TIGR02147 family)
MNIYRETDYRTVLKGLVEEGRELDRSVSFQALAAHVRVPKSYMSRVTHGDADLSPDQLYLACDYFDLTTEEEAYLQLLLEHARSGLERRRKELWQSILAEQRRHLDPGKHLETKESGADLPLQSEYYLDPIIQIVHAAIAIPHYQNDLKRLANELRVPPERVADAVNRLERMGVCERTPEGLAVREASLHLPKDSPLAVAWRNQLKLLAMQRLQVLPTEEAYAFSVVLSGSRALENTIRARFLEVLQDLKKAVEGAPPERVYQMSIELLPWA